MVITGVLILSVLAAILYRMGGAHGYNTKLRDCGVATCGVGALVLMNGPTRFSDWLALSYTAILLFLAQTTYFKKKGAKGVWWNWCLVGLANGVALLPYAIHTHLYAAFILRTVFLMVSIPVWSEHIENVVWEEAGRGALIVSSLILFL